MGPLKYARPCRGVQKQAGIIDHAECKYDLHVPVKRLQTKAALGAVFRRPFLPPITLPGPFSQLDLRIRVLGEPQPRRGSGGVEAYTMLWGATTRLTILLIIRATVLGGQ
jgi:hypothetical protein